MNMMMGMIPNILEVISFISTAQIGQPLITEKGELAAEKSGAVAEIFTSVMNFWGLLQQIRG
jgi:hypothetical protein